MTDLTPTTQPNEPTEPTQPETPPRKLRTRGREKRELMCPLTKPERRQRGARMARVELEVQALDGELEQLKMRARLLKARMDDLADERAKLARAIDSKQESRLIDCEWVESSEQNAWLLLRLDTKALIDTKAMTARELQLEIATEAVAPAEPVLDDGSGDDGDDGEQPAPKRKRKSKATPKANGKIKHEH